MSGTVEVKNLVSTHSHPKVAEIHLTFTIVNNFGFNTQPPEGG